MSILLVVPNWFSPSSEIQRSYPVSSFSGLGTKQYSVLFFKYTGFLNANVVATKVVTPPDSVDTFISPGALYSTPPGTVSYTHLRAHET